MALPDVDVTGPIAPPFAPRLAPPVGPALPRAPLSLAALRLVALRLAAVALAAGFALGCEADLAAQREAVVYGADGRTEVFAHPSAVLREVAASAGAVQIDASWIDASNPSDVRITYTGTHGEAQSLCRGQRFAEQIEPGTCSGTLVDERHILTAGHCVSTAADCADGAWVLGFRYAAAGTLATLTADDVYRCASVVARVEDRSIDFAFVRLDRPVRGHTPAVVSASPVAVGASVALIGHPNGIPMKIDSGGAVTWSSGDASWLTATVDAFSGNSGSGVFDTSGRLVAVLYGGADDYVSAGSCNVVNVIDPPPSNDGEGLVHVVHAVQAFCATGVSSPLCGCTPPCGEPLPGDACASAERIAPVSQTLTGTLSGYAADSTGTCGGAGPDRSYVFTLDRPARMVAQSAGFDTVLYLRAGGCEGGEVGCHDDVDSRTDRGSRLELRLEPGTYALFLDAYDASVGTFTLALTFALDGAPPGPDAGGTLMDGGVGGTDGGATLQDGAFVDAGAPGPSAAGEAGCGCSVPGSHATPAARLPLALLAALLPCLLLGRRGRRSAHPSRARTPRER